MVSLSLTIYPVAGGGFGYEITMNGIVINQEKLPSTDGDYLMSSSQATVLGTTVQMKIKKKLLPSLTREQAVLLIEGKKTPTQIVNEELGI